MKSINELEALDCEFYFGTSVDCTSVNELVPMSLEKYINLNPGHSKVFPEKKKRGFNLGKIKEICKNPFSKK